MRTIAIIVSAGKGKRFNSKIPKQYLKIEGIPIICRTIDAFQKSVLIDGIVLVCAKERISYCRKVTKDFGFNKVISVVAGGSTRAHSVYNGLLAVPKSIFIVAIHDGVRPLVTEKVIKDTITAAKKYGAAIAAVPPKNTVKEITKNGTIKKTLTRNNLIEVQTPQVFKYQLILDCYKRFHKKLKDVTDDSSLAEMAGHKVKTVFGGYDNIKITTQEDLELLKQKISPRETEMRKGVGYDIHRLVRKRPLFLGGVNIPYKLGLLGHSDADALLHAIADAMLGAVGERDIGWHFSNRDERFCGMPSKYFIIESKRILKNKGYKINNVDAVVIAEEPKLQPHYKEMVKNISGWLSIPQNSVTVKFTTPEETGPIGNKEAIAAMAVATAICI